MAKKIEKTDAGGTLEKETGKKEELMKLLSEAEKAGKVLDIRQEGDVITFFDKESKERKRVEFWPDGRLKSENTEVSRYFRG